MSLAVTLEFLGALGGLRSRRVTDTGCALIAGAAVVVLARPQGHQLQGVILALLAAACWARTSW